MNDVPFTEPEFDDGFIFRVFPLYFFVLLIWQYMTLSITAQYSEAWRLFVCRFLLAILVIKV